jgi:putrescine transport system permease protein
MIGRLISDEFSQARDWPMAAAIAVALLVLMVGPTMIYSRYQAKAEGST